GAITGTPGFLASLVVLAVIGLVVLLPTRRFHRVVTVLAGFGVAAFIAMFIFGLAATHRPSFAHNLPHYTGGVTANHIAATGAGTFLTPNHNSFISDLFSTTVFPFFLSILLFQYIGFQYSAYIAGEVRGNVRRSVLIALVGALVIGVAANSLYVDALSNHLGFGTNVSWGAAYWGFNERLRAPVNAILATLALTALFLFFQSYKALPTFLATTGHKLNLAGTAWFSITMALLTWTLPGLNAIFARWRRPGLMRNAPFVKALPLLGLVWLVFPVWIYIFAVGKPIKDALSASSGALTYLETNGIIDAGIFYAIGIVIFFVMRLR